jgi:hypothetical protein
MASRRIEGLDHSCSFTYRFHQNSPPVLILASGSIRLRIYSPPLKIARTIEETPQDQVQRFLLPSSATVFADVDDSFISTSNGMVVNCVLNCHIITPGSQSAQISK